MILVTQYSLSANGTGIQTPSQFSPDTLSSLVDVSLINTLAQISATFIAITAGFYTTKIISIINEKSRLSGRIKELETELLIVRTGSEPVQKELDLIDEKDSKDNIDLFTHELLTDLMLPSYKIKTVDDLIPIFEKYYERKPLPREEKILRDKSSDIVQKVLEFQEKERNTTVAFRSPRGEEQIVRAITDQNEKDRYRNLKERRDSTNIRLSVLEELLKIMKEELNAALYPKHIRFGFISFIVFAILGVIIPLTYGSWGTALLTAEQEGITLLSNMNAIVLILFGSGLALNFIYIFLELRVALSRRP